MTLKIIFNFKRPPVKGKVRPPPARTTSILGRLVDLRIDLWRRARLLGDEAMARAVIRADWEPALPEAVVETLPAGRGRALRAAFLVRPNPGALSGGRKCEVLLPPGDRAARRWLLGAIDRHTEALRAAGAVQLYRGNADLLPPLAERGFFVHSALLGGDPRRALGRLRRAYPDPAWGDVACRPLETRRQIQAVVRIMRDEFTRNPQFGFFAAGRVFLRDFAALMQRELQAGTQWVLVHRGEVAGHFGFVFAPRSAFGKPVARVGVTFRRDVQGRGLARLAYRTILERAVALGASLFVGGTSQPPVLHLGAVMGRPLIGWELRPGRPYFGPDHFRYPPR